jgi:hypothetical protein
VTLAPPAQYNFSGVLRDSRLYYSFLAISCREANGAANANALLPAVYAAFQAALDPMTGANPRLARKLGAPHLTYWWPPNTAGQTLAAMLSNADGSGACGAWSQLYQCMAGMHGVGGARLHGVEVRSNPLACTPPDVPSGFLVRRWTLTGPPLPAVQADHFTHTISNVRPNNTGVVANGNATWGPGLVGQSDRTPPPAFVNHFIVYDTVTQQFYDPSYGAGALDADPWMQGAIGGLRENNAGAGYVRDPALVPQLVTLLDMVTNLPPA